MPRKTMLDDDSDKEPSKEKPKPGKPVLPSLNSKRDEQRNSKQRPNPFKKEEIDQMESIKAEN